MKKRLMKVLALGLVMALSLGILAGCGAKKEEVAEQKEEKKFVFKLGHAADEENTWHKGAVKFAELVKEKSNGRIEVKVYPNEQLGNEMDNITGVQAGTADMVISGETLQNWAPKVGAMAIPYAIKDSETLQNIVNGEIGQEIEKEIIDKAGLRPLFWYERGPRYLTSNRPITTPDELNGMIVRVPNVPVFVKAWEALGAKPTPMAFSEVFTGLQQGTVEGQENPLALINSAGFYEVQKYVNKTAHVRSWIYVLMGEKQWESLPEDLQVVVMEAAKEAQAYEHELFLEQEEALATTLQERGMNFVDVDQDAFRTKVEASLKDALTEEQYEMYQKIKEVK
ncbi:TRAP transporter substrate-binding protein [Marinisporobacter balticus]|uniref:Tripartite ATP-independent transporter DctP family solute receptor n=1 Tax=Marinisporobacter balticus TaxID=2018667 RepID=A0A4R2KVQ8_9FIRM|nr:TRAP transporter substrate-binding protein [Marinisporobacter balticus]TCO76917.1 tripartite ATP-independent transporter DctP family solute receptor [Marinisporobacter balticus]